MTTVWSPASLSSAIEHSSQASVSGSSGRPAGDGRHSTPANLSAPDLAKPRPSPSCPAARMFTAKAPARLILGHVVDPLLGHIRISGGCRDSAENDWQVNPTGVSPSSAVTTVTPVQNRPRTAL